MSYPAGCIAQVSIDVTRAQVMAYRIAATGLGRATAVPPSALPVLDLGVQDTPYGTARLALAARTTAPPEDDALTLVWATRGAPHLHRREDVASVARALWPLSDADATARIMNPRIADGARLGIAAFTAAAEALREVVTEPMPKGDVSREVSARVPETLTFDCAPCKARHISGALFQLVGAAAGVEVTPRGRATELAPLPGRPPVPESASGTSALVRAYLRLLGPATPADAAAYVDATRANLAPAWPGDLTEVRVDGRATWLPEDCVDALLAAPEPDHVRFLTVRDPLLQARDRAVLVPDRAHQKQLWAPLGSPGAVLANGEITGTWRAKASGKSLTLTVSPFAPLSAAVRAALEKEAQIVAEARGAPSARLDISEPA